MKKRKTSKGRVRVVAIEEAQALMAEHLRLAYRQLNWAAKNLAAMYDLVKPEGAPDLEDPNQLKLFDDGKESNDN